VKLQVKTQLHQADGQEPTGNGAFAPSPIQLQFDGMSDGSFIGTLDKNRFLWSFIISGHLITASRAENGP